MKKMILIVLALCGIVHGESILGGSGSLFGGSSSQIDVGNSVIISADDDILTEYANLASTDNDAEMGAVTDTNRRCLILMPGVYSTGGIQFFLSQYVDIMGVSKAAFIDCSEVSGAVACIIPPQLSTAETGVSNFLTNLSAFGTKTLGINTGSGSKVITVVDNCYITGDTDCIWTATLASRVWEIRSYSSTFKSNFDVIALLNLSANKATGYFYNCHLTCIADNSLGTNPEYKTRCLYTTNQKAYAFGCFISSLSDPSAVPDADASAHAISCEGSGEISVYNCKMSSSATKNATGSVEDGDCIQNKTTGTVNVYGGNIDLSLNGNDLSNESTGTILASNLVYDETKTSGTITFKNNIDSQGSTGATTAANGTIEVNVDGTIYYLLKAATP